MCQSDSSKLPSPSASSERAGGFLMLFPSSSVVDRVSVKLQLLSNMCCPGCSGAAAAAAISSKVAAVREMRRSSGSLVSSNTPLLSYSHESSVRQYSINSKEEREAELIIHNYSACQKSQKLSTSLQQNQHSTTTSSSNPARKRRRTFKYNSSVFGWRPFLHLLLGLFLLCHPKSAMSSPVRMHDTGSPSSSSSDTGEHVRHQRPAKWINPCRIPTTIPTLPEDFDVQQQSDVDIFKNIITQVSKAEHQAREFMDAFFEESFGLKLEQERDKFKDLHQDWMADVAKRVGKYLGEEVNPAKLEELTVEETLRSMYEGLQKFAVGLEQIVLDQAVYGGNYHQHFHEAEFQLKYVLCELQIAMLEKSITYQDITREIMSQSYRDLDSKTARDIRDWLIFRDYVNVLEYLKQVFKHFLHKANDDNR